MPVKIERVVLTQAELARIRAKVTKTPETDADARRRYLKILSDERVSHWPNTLEAHRQNKENWKKEQEDIIEAKRRDTDKEEAFLQRQLRAETIKRANDKLYEQTGKMKLLRSNLLYAETRNDQIAENAERHVDEEALAAAYHQEIKRQVADGDAKEKSAVDARAAKAKVTAKKQQEQLQEFQTAYIASLVKEKEDGDETQRTAKAAIEAEEEEKQALKIKNRAEMEKMLAANQDLHERKAQRISEELDYMEKCRQQRNVLDRAARARKSLEAKRFNEKQAVRQQMIDKATRELEAARRTADNKAEKEARQQRQKEDDAAARKIKAREDLRQQIDKSRAIQIRQRAEKGEARRAEDKEIKAYFQHRGSEMDRLEKEEEAARLDREKQLRKAQRLQARERNEKEMALQAFEAVNHARMLSAQGDEDARFKKIVHGYMDEFDARGQSTYLLHRTLNHKNPEMFPSGNLQL
ncbi:unnamed protein product [Pylaiella littoralis]